MFPTEPGGQLRSVQFTDLPNALKGEVDLQAHHHNSGR